MSYCRCCLFAPGVIVDQWCIEKISILGDILPPAAVVNEAMSDNIDPELLEFAQEQELAADSMVTQAVEAVADTVVNVPADDFPKLHARMVLLL